MDREKAFDLVKKYIKNKNLIKHSLAVEAIMKEIAKELNNVKSKSKGKKLCDEKKWAIVCKIGKNGHPKLFLRTPKIVFADTEN